MAAPRSLLKGFEKTVAMAKPDPLKRVLLSDPDTRGLYVRVMPTGTKTYTVVARDPKGTQVWAVVGNCDEISLEDARDLAREGVKRIKAGQGAFPKADPVPDPDTFQQVHDNFIVRYVDRKGLRSAVETKRIFTRYVLPKWKDRPFASIRRSDVAELLDEIEDGKGGADGNLGGPVMADRTLAAISKLFNWYATRDDEYTTPVVRGMHRAEKYKRDRILSDEEIRLLWAREGQFVDFLKLSLLDAQRSAKNQTIRRSDIVDGVWHIASEPGEKTNAGTLQLSQMALDVIQAQPEIEGNPYVFAGRGDAPMWPGDKLKKQLDAEIAKANGGEPIPHWTVHDLRRSAKSLMARAGVRPDISERVLGHAIVGVAAAYDHHDYAEEKADALRKLAALIELIVNPPADNVVAMRRG